MFTVTKVLPVQQISTHTPAWGATKNWQNVNGEIKNFNSHARVGRDLLEASNSGSVTAHFNSHARVGRDRSTDDALFFILISTHTPAWGATRL